MEYVLVQELSNHCDNRTKEKSHQHNSDVGLATKEDTDHDDQEIIADSDHSKGHLFQDLFRDDLWHCIVGRNTHVGVDVEGYGNDETKQRQCKDHTSVGHISEVVLRNCLFPNPVEEVNNIANEYHVGDGSEADLVSAK